MPTDRSRKLLSGWLFGWSASDISVVASVIIE